MTREYVKTPSLLGQQKRLSAPEALEVFSDTVHYNDLDGPIVSNFA